MISLSLINELQEQLLANEATGEEISINAAEAENLEAEGESDVSIVVKDLSHH